MHDKATPHEVFLERRKLIEKAIKVGLLMASPPLAFAKPSQTEDDYITDVNKATRYNNYYEFSQNKESVFKLAEHFSPKPWSIECSGLIENPQTINIEAFEHIQEYVYRFRCVEGWSMVIPWQGFQLNTLLDKLKPLPGARYVKFSSIYRPEEMIGQRRPIMEWPYTEGLRLDEAMHPLTILATGMYKQTLPNQNGAPIRLIVPWKYGFKSIKAVAKIELVSEPPISTWSKISPSEYGFYGNVNPRVAHPRWSQRRELRLGETKKIKTLMFNGYEHEVAHLYKDLDLKENY